MTFEIKMEEYFPLQRKNTLEDSLHQKSLKFQKSLGVKAVYNIVSIVLVLPVRCFSRSSTNRIERAVAIPKHLSLRGGVFCSFF